MTHRTLGLGIRGWWPLVAFMLVVVQVADLGAQSSYTVVTLAGRPAQGSSDGAGTAAAFYHPHGIGVALSGAIYIADTDNHTVRRIGTDGVVSTVAGVAGLAGSSNGIGTTARFNTPRGVAVSPAGIAYVIDNTGVRQIAADGTVTTLTFSFSMGTSVLHGITHDGGDNLYVAAPFAVWRIPTATGTPTLLAGGSSAGYVDGSGNAVRFNQAHSLVVGPDGNIFVTDFINQRVRRITPAGVTTTVAVLPAAADNSAGAWGIAVDSAGVLYVANSVTHDILRVTQAGVVTVFAGTTGTAGSADGAGTAASFNEPRNLAMNASGTLYVADTNNSIIRTVSSSGQVTTLAGAVGGSGNIDAATITARFNGPRGLTVGGGVVYVADYNNCTIRAVTGSGATSTFAGTVAASQAAACGSVDGTGTAAKFAFPSGIARDSAGNLFVADTTNNTIRKITPAGVVTTFAGFAGSSGSTDGTGTAARFTVPRAWRLMRRTTSTWPTWAITSSA